MKTHTLSWFIHCTRLICGMGLFATTQVRAQTPSPEISIVNTSTSAELVDGDTQSFGTRLADTSVSLTLSIQNTGTADLTGLSITLDGADAADFTLTSMPMPPVAGPLGQTSFTVQFTPRGLGKRNAALHITSNDTDESPFDLMLQGSGSSAGGRWTPQTSGTDRILNNVDFVDANNGFAVGDFRTFGKTTDGGTTWSFSSLSAVSNSYYGVSFVNPQIGWLSAVFGGLAKTEDGGTTWTVQTPPTGAHVWSVNALTSTTAWCVGSSGMAGRTTNGGTTWLGGQSNPPENNDGGGEGIQEIQFVDANNGYFAAGKGWSSKSTDGGVTWTRMTIPTQAHMNHLHFPEVNTGWIVGNEGTIIKTSDAGATWTAQTSGTTNNLIGAYFVDASTGWIVGDKGTILRTSNGGTTWSPEVSGTTKYLSDVDFADASTGWIVGEEGLILKYGAPEISVEQPAGTALNDGSSQSFGSAFIGQSKSLTYTIQSTGTVGLTNLALTKTGAQAGDFIITPLTSSALAPDGSLTFTVTFTPTALGARTATIRVASNDSNESPFDLIVSGAGSAPEIDIEQPTGTPVADGSGIVNFGSSLTAGSPELRNFTVKNTGTSDLQLGSIVIDGAHASEFTAFDPIVTTLAPAESTTFSVQFFPTTSGTRTAALHLINNDSTESPYDIKLTASVAAPEISVEYPAGTVLGNGSFTIPFGTAIPSTETLRTLTLKNLGNAPLTGISVSLGGLHAARFRVVTAPPSTLAPGATGTFVAGFTPDSVGVFGGSMTVASNDFDEAAFFVGVNGVGRATLAPLISTPPASRIIALGQPVSFTTVVDSPTSFTSEWSKGTATLTKIAGAKTTSFTLPSVKMTDAMTYQFRAINAAGPTDSSPASLTVVDRSVKYLNMPVDETVRMTAAAAGSGLNYRWLKNGADLPADSRYVVDSATPNLLTIITLVDTDAASYTCQITSAGGQMESGAHVLTVFDSAPIISPDPVVMDDAILSGDYSFFIPLDAMGGSATSFTASPLPPGLKLNATTGEIYGRPTSAKSYALTLTAKNSIGTDSAPATLVVKVLTPGAAGDYIGIIERGPVSGGLGGRLDLKITPTGSYTGKVILGSKTHPLPAGSINADTGSSLVTAALSIKRPPLPQLDVTFTIDTDTKRFTSGSITSATFGSSTFSGWRNTWSTTTQSSQYDGYYTFSLDVPSPLVGDNDIPQGLGFGSFKVPLKGESFTTSGRTADGDTFTSSAFLGPDGDLAFFDDLPAKGSLLGMLDIVPGTGPGFDDNTLVGNLTWSRPANTAAAYAAGFNPFSLIATGGSYISPATTSIVLGKPTPATAGNGALAFFDAGIGGPPSRADRLVSLLPGASLNIAAAGLTQTTLKITPATGAFSGGFTLVDAHPVTPGVKPITRKPTFQGIIVPTPTGHEGHGFFLLQQLPEPVYPQPKVLPTLSGGVILE
jgi:photosystem II stability/assembly factor-like uncharacterized protein